MFYLDTSLLVAAIMQESKSDEIRAWLGEQAPKDLSISDWVTTEFSSALSIKMRTGEINFDQRALALAAFAGMSAQSMSIFPVERQHFRAAAQYCDGHTINLRAGDALHLAIAAANSAVICTRDERLAKAGPALGIGTRLF